MLWFKGTVDSSGNLYWLEYKDGSYRIGSARIDGTIRFRSAPAAEWSTSALLIAADTLVWLTLEDSAHPVASGYSTATGDRLWRRELLPLMQDWYREAANNSRQGGIDGAAVSRTAVVLTVGTGYKVESGYVALAAATGAVLWVARTTDKDTLMMASPPSPSQSPGMLFGSQILHDHTDLFRFTGVDPPAPFFSGPNSETSVLLAAPGPVLLMSASNDFPPVMHTEIRCQNDGALIASFDTGVSLYADGPDSAWFVQRSGALSRYDVRTGTLAARVEVAPSRPSMTSAAGILWVEQTIKYLGGLSSGRQQGPPQLRVVSPEGVEVRRRALPQETEAYDGAHAASFGDRILLEGEVLPSVGAYGVIRAIDLPGWSAESVKR